jgi:hypothetical protein
VVIKRLEQDRIKVVRLIIVEVETSSSYAFAVLAKQPFSIPIFSSSPTLLWSNYFHDIALLRNVAWHSYDADHGGTLAVGLQSDSPILIFLKG